MPWVLIVGCVQPPQLADFHRVFLTHALARSVTEEDNTKMCILLFT